MIAIFLVFLAIIGGYAPCAAAELAIVHGRVLDLAGTSVAGADVQVFDSSDVRRPSDYLSNRTGKNGRYQVRIPAGRYWLVAILRTDGRKFGPLAAADKHSGTPLIIEIDPGEDIEQDFTVLSLREAALRQVKRNESLVRIKGRILDRSGSPVVMACVLADRSSRPGAIPDYVSGWTDRDGRFLLFVPRGSYYIGTASAFPPPAGIILPVKKDFVHDESGVDLTVDDSPTSRPGDDEIGK